MKNRDNNITLEEKIKKFIIVVMALIFGTFLLAIIVTYSYGNKYREILHNVTTASEFNQDFKEDIDLKMYYYVVNSNYSTGLPIEEVKDAQQLAESLLKTTTEKESWKAICAVKKLCMNLEGKIYQVEETSNYEKRNEQLENNIYILTELIENYMYTYLYHESAHLDELQKQMTKKLFIEFAVLFLALIIMYLFLTRWMLRFGYSITSPISKLCKRVQAIGAGDLTVQTPVIAKEKEIQTLSNGFERMVDHLNQLMEQNKQEQMSLRNAELALLQAQINPHFLYNTLDTIIWLIETEKYDLATEMITSLSQYFRSSLSKGRDIITLREEEQHVRSYLEIQHTRYKDILEYQIDIDQKLWEYEIPKLTLQPLVENALYHGIKLKRGKGKITVTGKQEGEDILLVVSDNGAGMDKERLQEIQKSMQGWKEKEMRIGFGLSTVHERLQLLFGPQSGIEIKSEKMQGTMVYVKLPCKKGEGS